MSTQREPGWVEAGASEGPVRITRVGGPTALIEFAGWRLVTDPTFDPAGRRYNFGWGTSSVKLSGPALTPGELGRVDAVLLSHDQHGDNLDDAGRAWLTSVETVITTRPAAKRLAGAGARELRGLRAGESTMLERPGAAPLRRTATPCRHGPPLSEALVGEVIGFTLWAAADRAVVWVTGDTVLTRRLLRQARVLEVEVLVPHLGGVRFPITGPLRYSMGARQAERLVAALAPAAVVPVHFDGWEHFREGREVASATLASDASVGCLVHWLAAVESVEIAL